MSSIKPIFNKPLNSSARVKSTLPRPPKWHFKLDGILLLFFLAFATASCLILYNGTPGSYSLVTRQLFHYLIGLIVFIFIAQLPSTLFRRITPYLYLSGIALLLLVLLFGLTSNGAKRWLNLGIFTVQPSEFFKLLLPLTLAWWFDFCDAHKVDKLQMWSVATIFIFIPVFFIFTQPDLGSAIMIIISGLTVIFLAGISWKIILSISLLSTLSLPFIWYGLHSYQQNRILTFLDPHKDPLGSGYHIIQSQISIGSGGLTGKGWGLGSQTKLNFLPENHTDFIFSGIAESFGFIGSALIILLLLGLCIYGLKISRHQKNRFLSLLTASLAILIFFYSFVNIAMTIGLIPVVGLPLPLISYGGSSLVTYSIILGILSSARHQKY